MPLRASTRRAGRPRHVRSVRLSLVAALLLPGAAVAASAQTAPGAGELRAIADGIDRPAVGAVVPWSSPLEVGRARITPGAGASARMLVAEGKPVGLLLDGQATVAYRVEDRFSIPVATHNLRRASGITVDPAAGTLTVTIPVTGAAVWGWDLREAVAAPAAPAGGGLPDWLTRILDGRLDANPARDLMLAAANGDDGYRWAVFHGTRDDFLLDVDPRPVARAEHLARFMEVTRDAGPYAGRLIPEEMAAQPAGRAWWEPAAVEFLATDTDLAARNEQGEHLEVTSRTRLESLRDGLRLLTFALTDELLDPHLKLRSYRIGRLTVDGQPARYLHRTDSLLVELPRALRKGESVLLEVSVQGDVLIRPEGSNYWRLGNFAWYPRPFGGGREWSEFRIRADVAAPFVPFGPGETLERSATRESNHVATRLKGPMEGAFLLAGKYTTQRVSARDAHVDVSSYAMPKKAEAERLGNIVLAVRSCLESWTGVPYPFPDLQVIEVNDWGWGQAPPGFVFITQEAFLTPARARLDSVDDYAPSITDAEVFTRGVNERVAHEIAHGWFPHVAKVSRAEENWLSESLAEYSSAYCLQQAMGDKRQGRFFFDRQLATWNLWSSSAVEGASIYLAGHLANTEKDAASWRYLLYGRGPLAVHAIRKELVRTKGEKEGEAMFLSWLRSYVKSFTYKPAETRHLIGILNQISGQNWQPFFERHVYGPEGLKID
ncbi:MAG: M1 family metallopeptidase [Thermoanaerobaculia bacterium]|nr:MAG: M1 family metallopeptidase [Thermoanaerobaculia bacterium]